MVSLTVVSTTLLFIHQFIQPLNQLIHSIICPSIPNLLCTYPIYYLTQYPIIKLQSFYLLQTKIDISQLSMLKCHSRVIHEKLSYTPKCHSSNKLIKPKQQINCTIPFSHLTNWLLTTNKAEAEPVSSDSLSSSPISLCDSRFQPAAWKHNRSESLRKTVLYYKSRIFYWNIESHSALTQTSLKLTLQNKSTLSQQIVDQDFGKGASDGAKHQQYFGDGDSIRVKHKMCQVRRQGSKDNC